MNEEDTVVHKLWAAMEQLPKGTMTGCKYKTLTAPRRARWPELF